ncbi:uncharacterized protein EV420DRAFT_1650606 [Desarmillaria tabescens]|uniref:Uncharacterized protein n=1 Tax=Armillaria tabescens TaxID=1929756 RepID=A0AA39MMG4_ARMTA|nr:uncharacterized protein EV420DRAFT_1650606 [Desarmillaria tabescens]KAK0440206.1 hypothetical protein EV420DRAFT_1650606 [Desarmillaria tabescens]
MTAISFPPKPPPLSEVIARLEDLVSVQVPKFASPEKVDEWFKAARQVIDQITIHYHDIRGSQSFTRLTRKITILLRVHDYYSAWARLRLHSRRGGSTFDSSLSPLSLPLEGFREPPPRFPSPPPSPSDDDVPMSGPNPSPCIVQGSPSWGRSSWSITTSHPSSDDENATVHGTTPSISKGPGSKTNGSEVGGWFATGPGDWDPLPTIEDLAAKQGTLGDAQAIADKISERVAPRTPFEGQAFGSSFCAFCSGTPRHAAHECPARSTKAFHIIATEKIDSMVFADEPGMHPGTFGVRFDLRLGKEKEAWVRSLMVN